MKQLGNLAIVCAKRPDVLMQVCGGTVTVFIGMGPKHTSLSAAWDDDMAIGRMIHDMNYGKYKREEAA